MKVLLRNFNIKKCLKNVRQEQGLQTILFTLLFSGLPTINGIYLLAEGLNLQTKNYEDVLDYYPPVSFREIHDFVQPTIEWEKTIGGSGIDELFSITQTSDGGYSDSPASGDKSENNVIEDYWIIKLNFNNPPVLSSLTLIDATTDQAIKELNDGDVISLDEVGNKLLNIRANVTGSIDSVALKLQGPISHTRTEQVSPYALFGDTEGDYQGKALITGKYTLMVTPYTKNKKWVSHSVSFQVVEEDIAKLTIEWDKTLGGNYYDELRSVITTPDGGYLLAGFSESDASGDKSEDSKGDIDYWVVKTNAQGTKIWDKSFGGNGTDLLSNIIPTLDGGYLLTGGSRSDASGDKSESSGGEYEYWVVKMDAQGNKIWDKTIKGINYEGLRNVISIPDENHLLIGLSGSGNYWIKKIDALGNKIWDNTIEGIGHASFSNAIPTSDGGYLLGGGSQSDYFVVKIDGEGNKIWNKTFGGSDDDRYKITIPTSDGGYLVGGSSNSLTSGEKSEDRKFGYDFWVIKIDADGNKVWDKTIGGDTHDRFGSVISTPDGGYLLGGTFESGDNASTTPIPGENGLSTSNFTPGTFGDRSERSNGRDDFWVIKIDGQGNKVWDKVIGGEGYDELHSVILSPEGGYLLGGSSTSDISGDKSEEPRSRFAFDYWIVKLTDENAPVVTNLTLIDAATDQEIKELNDGDVINPAEIGSGLLNIRANTTGPIDHVYLKLQGPIRVNRTEREFPYALFGDIEGDYEGRQMLPGNYTLTVTPYGGIDYIISFEVTFAPEATARQIKLFPIPTSDIIHILHEGGEGTQLMLTDFGGNVLLQQPLRQQPVEQLDMNAFQKGIYYLRIISPEGVQVIRVAKE